MEALQFFSDDFQDKNSQECKQELAVLAKIKGYQEYLKSFG